MSTALELRAHRLAELIPPMTAEEYEPFKADIAENGLLEPIVLYEGKILDGRHRARVCSELGISPTTREYEGDDPEVYILSENVYRRNLTTTQKALIVLEVLPAYRARALERKAEGGRKAAPGRKSGSKEPHFPKNRAAAEAAEKIGISGATVRRLDRVRRDDPDLFEKVKAGSVSVTTAEKDLRERSVPPVSDNGKPSPKMDPGSKRGQELMQGAKKRVEHAVGTCNGLARGLGHLRIDWATSVATPEEIEGWDEAFAEAITALQQLRKRVKESK